jgi:acyl carrier protein
MTRNEIFEEVIAIFRDVFDDEELEVVEGTSSKDIEDWDSLEHINLILAMENKFKVKFVLDEVALLNNVGEMVDLIKQKVSENE